LYFYTEVLNLCHKVSSQDCSSRSDNADYMGSKSVTENNEPCQFWSRYLEFNPGADLRLIDSKKQKYSF